MAFRSLLVGLGAAVLLAGSAHAAASGRAGRVAASLPPSNQLLIGSALEVVVENVRVARGHVHIDVCSQETFLNEKDCIYSATAPAVAGVTTVIVPKVPAGRYAIQAYLDENDNGKVDRNALGIPKEEVGFSGNPLLLTGPPRWKTVSFEHGPAGGSIHLKLRGFP